MIFCSLPFPEEPSKRLVYRGGDGGNGNANTRTNRSRNADENPDRGREASPRRSERHHKVKEEQRELIGDVLSDIKADELKDREDMDAQAVQLLNDLKKLATTEATQEWIIKTYGQRYPALVADPTAANIAQIATQERARFTTIGDARTFERINAIREGKPTMNYSEAIGHITGGRPIDDNNTARFVEGLDLDNTNTVELHETHRQITEMKAELEAAKANLGPLDAEIESLKAGHEGIKKNRESWEKWKWGYFGLWTSKTAKAYGASQAYWASGAAMLGLASLGAGVAVAGKAAFNLFFAPIIKGAPLAASLAGGPLAAVGYAGAIGVGLATWHFGTGPLYSYLRGGLQNWRIGGAKRRHRLAYNANVQPIQDRIDEAQQRINGFQIENKAKISGLKQHRSHYENARNSLNSRIEQAAVTGENLPELQAELAEVSRMILAIDSILVVLESANKPQDLGPDVNLSEDDIGTAITAMQLETEREQAMQQLAAEIDAEQRKERKTALDSKFKEGIVREARVLADRPIYANILTFFSPLGAGAPPQFNAALLNELRDQAPELHNLIRSMGNMSANADLQKVMRDALHPILRRLGREVTLSPERQGALEALEDIRDSRLKRTIRNRPNRIRTFLRTQNHDGLNVNHGQLPEPEGAGRGSFEDWLDDDRMGTNEYRRIEETLIYIGNNCSLGNSGEIINSTVQLRAEVMRHFNRLEDDEGVQEQLNDNAKEALENATGKVGRAVSVDIPEDAGDFEASVGQIRDQNALKTIKKALVDIRGKLYYNENKREFELTREIDEKLDRNLENLQTRKAAVYQAIRRNPVLITRVRTTPPRLEAPGEDEAHDLEAYIDTLNYAQKNKMIEAIARIHRDNLVVNHDGSGLETQEENLKYQISQAIEALQASPRVNIPDDVTITRRIFLGGCEALVERSLGRRRPPEMPGAENQSLTEAVDDIVGNIDVLQQILSYVGEITRKCYYDRDLNGEGGLRLWRNGDTPRPAPDDGGGDGAAPGRGPDGDGGGDRPEGDPEAVRANLEQLSRESREGIRELYERLVRGNRSREGRPYAELGNLIRGILDPFRELVGADDEETRRRLLRNVNNQLNTIQRRLAEFDDIDNRLYEDILGELRQDLMDYVDAENDLDGL